MRVPDLGVNTGQLGSNNIRSSVKNEIFPVLSFCLASPQSVCHHLPLPPAPALLQEAPQDQRSGGGGDHRALPPPRGLAVLQDRQDGRLQRQDQCGELSGLQPSAFLRGGEISGQDL